MGRAREGIVYPLSYKLSAANLFCDKQKNETALAVSFLVTRTGIEPMLPP